MRKSRVKHPRCRWCKKRLDSKGHREITESFCFILNEKTIRSRHRPKVKSIADVYGPDDRIKPEFIGTDMEDKLMARQREMAVDALLGLNLNGYKIPKNIDVFIQGGFIWGQIAVRKPWAVYVLVEGRRKRKRFNNLKEAIAYHARISKRYPDSGIVSLGHSYELPARYRLKKDKLPKKYKWCPRCGTFRVFKRVYPEQSFSAMRKVWSNEKNRYIWKDQNIWLTECQLCGLTNRDSVMRKCNLPYEIRKIKRGVKRVKPRVRTARGRAARANKRSRRR